MRSLTSLFCLVVLLVGACGAGGPPSVTEWRQNTWSPLVGVVPEPSNATPTTCDEALSRLRERSEKLQPAPDAALGDAAAAWLRRAETLVFQCASEAADHDYQAGYEDLGRLQAEVQSLLASSR